MGNPQEYPLTYLNSGVVTQNGTYISYKTSSYTSSLDSILRFKEELKNFLEAEKITFDGTWNIGYADADHPRRADCLTIYVKSTDPQIDKFPYQGHAYN